MKYLQPPLPIPEKVTEHDSCKWFTESQLLAYRAEVIEMCAKFVEARFDECEPWVTPDDVRSLK